MAAALVTKRELECAKMLMSGVHGKEAAHRLGVTMKTLAAHIYNLRQKLDVRTASQLTKRLIDLGYVEAGLGVEYSREKIEAAIRVGVEQGMKVAIEAAMNSLAASA